MADAGAHLSCESCGISQPLDFHFPTCPACGGLFDVTLPGPTLSATALKAVFQERHAHRVGAEASGVWRYRELLPHVEDDHIVSWPEGNTPLLRSAAVAKWTGVSNLRLKHEGMNPTGSFKDRGMTVAVTQARAIGASAVACASTGNTSASMAAYAAIAGLPALVFIPEGRVALGKLTQTIAYGATTLTVDGDFDDCLALARRASEALGVYLLNSVNAFRIEGQKTIAIELLHQLEWKSPDWIALPAGNLGNTAAMGRALVQLAEAGLIPRMPRILAVQAEGAAPFARSFADGFTVRHRVTADTVATAIRIGDPASHDRAVRALRSSAGHAMMVSDEEILSAKAVIDRAGVGCEPASAATAAGVRRARQEGLIKAADSVVCVLTGHLLKDPEATLHFHRDQLPAPALANPTVKLPKGWSDAEAVLRDLLDR